jgi:N-acetylglucosaminyldiphosphoundecaprenol N-acetyl-beta-D-mannosaminyltransferase
MNGIQRKKILGVPVDLVDRNDAINYIDHLIKADTKGHYIFAINAEKVMALRQDGFLREMAEHACLVIPDGMGAVLGIRVLYGEKIKRVSGVDLMHTLCKESAIKGYRIFIYGGKEDVNQKAVSRLRILYPGIKIVGRCNGYISADDIEKLVTQINETGVDILFVALGSPKQERWIQKYLPRLNVKVCQGIGGTLDTITGDVKRAPLFLQRAGLEWFYRLISEPWRIRRQLVLPVFVIEVFKERLKRKATA